MVTALSGPTQYIMVDDSEEEIWAPPKESYNVSDRWHSIALQYVKRNSIQKEAIALVEKASYDDAFAKLFEVSVGAVEAELSEGEKDLHTYLSTAIYLANNNLFWWKPELDTPRSRRHIVMAVKMCSFSQFQCAKHHFEGYSMDHVQDSLQALWQLKRYLTMFHTVKKDDLITMAKGGYPDLFPGFCQVRRDHMATQGMLLYIISKTATDILSQTRFLLKTA